ncbi:MAG TPA: tripartite tricarboxylate transporter substrate binding protein [Burkholderiales bacterium]|nr:tripartite tricarboxylate transporter substrate binding protein [Burkholderiales bacterium]
MKTAAFSLCLLCIAGGAAAQSYPAKPVRLLSGFPAGGANDYHARVLAQKLTEFFGQTVIVENRGGAGGTIAADAIAKAAPDGYNLLMGFGSLAVAPSVYAKLPFDVLKDFTAVSLACRIQNVLVVPSALPAKNVQELIALARAHPGKMNYASSGTGATPHLSAEMFKAIAKVDITHIPYKGDTPAFVDLLAGQVDMMITVVQSTLVHIESGKLRPLAVTGLKRTASLPKVPTMQEAGLTGYELTSWFGVMGPANMPRDVLDRLNGAVVKAIAQKDLQDKFVAGGSEPEASTSEQFAQLIRDDVAKFARIVKAAGIVPQ